MTLTVLPRDFIEDALRDQGFVLDHSSLIVRCRSRRRGEASWKGGAKEAANPAYAKVRSPIKTEPDFYFGTTAKDCRIQAIITKIGPVNELIPGESGRGHSGPHGDLCGIGRAGGGHRGVL